MARKHKLALAIVLAVGLPEAATAVWSNDPANSAIEVVSAGNTPHLVADKDGGVYVSYRNGGYYWRNPNNSGFDVFVQHYNANGEQSWAEPIRVFDTSKGFASYYGLAIDENNDAYIANDVYPGGNPSDHATVQVAKLKRDGTFAWNTPLNLTPDADYANNGLGITMDAKGKHVVVSWAKGFSGYTVDGFSALACLNSDGDILWQQDVQIDGRYTFATSPIVMQDSVMVLLEVAAEVGTTNSHYYVQKYSLTDGSPLWAKPVAITSGDNFLHPVDSARSVEVIDDGEGGVVLSWYHLTGYNQGIILVQHVHADGSKAFSGQGLRVSGELLGNGATSLAYDGQNIYVTWSVNKKDYGADDKVHDYAGVRGVAISRSGDFLWDENGNPEPKFLMPWRQVVTDSALPFDDWFKGYTNPALVFNQNGNLNLTYGAETNFAYHLYAQVIAPATGNNIGDAVSFSNGAVSVEGQVARTRTIFGQPVMAYPLKGYPNGPVRLLNFDGTAHSGVSQDVLVEQVPTQMLSPGQQKSLSLKVLDNVGTSHDFTASSSSSEVSAELTSDSAPLNLTISTDNLLTDAVPVTVTAQDLDTLSRVGTSVVKVQAPHIFAPVIKPIPDQQLSEGESLSVAVEVQSMVDGNVEIQWQQSAGPAIDFQADGAQLSINSHYVAEDTLVGFTVTASAAGQVSSQSFNLTVNNSVSPTISGSNTEAAPGKPFSITPAISGAHAPVSLNWTQSSGANTVYTMDADGTLHGTAPLTTGVVTLSLHAVDANGESFSHDFQVNVKNPDQPSSGGSSGWLGLLLGLLAIPLRRNHKSDTHQI